MSFETSNWQQADYVTRPLPHSVGCEKSCLSVLMQFPDAWHERGDLSPEWFYLPQNRVLYAEMALLAESGQEFELVGFVQRLLDGGKLESSGGAGNISEVYMYQPVASHFQSHLEELRKKYACRMAIRLANDIIATANEAPEGAELVEATSAPITALHDLISGNSNAKDDSNKPAIDKIIDDFQSLVRGDKKAGKGISTGFEKLDEYTNGLKGGQVYVVGARPSMGKTSFMMNIVEHVCIDLDESTLVFSCEMTKEQLLDRLIFARSKFHKGPIYRGDTPKKAEMERIRKATMDIMAAKLTIDERSAPTISDIKAKAHTTKRKKGLSLIAIDYLQLLRSISKQAQGSREREIAEISAGIKGIAKELNIPIILLAQINRDSEKRTGASKGRPRMADLRESGAIEQDADFIGMLYRPMQFADSEEERVALQGRAELIIAKNRNGATGTCPLIFIEELMRFETGAPWEEDFNPQTTRKKPVNF